MPTRDSLDRRIASGTALTYVGFFSGKVIVFVNTVLLARLLLPEHFGLVAIGLLVLAVSETLAEGGTGAAVVWRPGAVEETAPVALSIGLIGAAVMSLAAFVAAPAIAQFFGEEGVIPIIRTLALAALISAPASVFSGILQRRMAFGRRLVPEIAKALTKGAVGIPLAYLGYGEWSLVWGHLAGTAVGLLLAWRLCGWRARLGLEAEVLRQVLPYGLQIAAVGIVGLAIRRIDVTIIGYSLDLTELGYYTLAFALIEISVMGLVWSASQAFFPAFSQSGLDRAEMATRFGRGLSALLAVTFPLGFGLAVMAEPLILTLFGAKWADAALPVQILAFYALVFTVGFNLGDVYKATGRPGILTTINLANLLVAAPVLLVAAQWGIVGVALGQVLVAGVISAINWLVAGRLSGIGLQVLFAAAAAPLAAAAGMAALCLALDGWVMVGAQEPLRLLVGIVAGLTSYAALLWVIRPELARSLLPRQRR